MDNLILIALPEEAPDLVNRPDVFFTGIGKVNAAITAMRVINEYHPQRIINFGTAGGITVSSGLYKCTRFVQRDLIIPDIGIAITGNDPIEFETGGFTVSTGDDFVMNAKDIINADLVEMEAYAIAKVCKETYTDFLCYKYISDAADEHASGNWANSVSKGQPYYQEILKKLNIW